MIDTSMPDTLSVNEKEYEIIELLGKGKGGYSYLANTKRIRFTKIQEKKLYQNPTKHIEAFSRALIMYLLIALIDGYLLTLF